MRLVRCAVDVVTAEPVAVASSRWIRERRSGAAHCLLGGEAVELRTTSRLGSSMCLAGVGCAVEGLQEQAGDDPVLVGQRLVDRGQAGVGGIGQAVKADDRQCLRDRQVPLVRRLDGALGASRSVVALA